MKAIETHYAGCRFRSRLEARWAVFFDHLGIVWEYEPQGFMVEGIMGGEPRPYLPDFYLPATGTWCEVKGCAGELDCQLLADAVDWGNGLPGTDDSSGTTNGLLILGPIPAPYDRAVGHPILQHSRGGWVNLASFNPAGLRINTDRQSYFDSSWGEQSKLQAYLTMSIRGLPENEWMHPHVAVAYRVARSARFEHGEGPDGPRRRGRR